MEVFILVNYDLYESGYEILGVFDSKALAMEVAQNTYGMGDCVIDDPTNPGAGQGYRISWSFTGKGYRTKYTLESWVVPPSPPPPAPLPGGA